MTNRRSGTTRTSLRRRQAWRRAEKLAGAKIGALLVTRGQDVRYLSGFTGDDSFLLTGSGWTVLLTDGRYAEQAARECPGLEIRVRTGSMTAALKDALAARRVRSLGVQSEHMTLQLHDALRKAARAVRLRPVTGAISPLRQVKDAAEIRAFRQLTGRGRKAFVGRTEREVAAELDYLMRLGGASGPAFETIVAAGAHASLPHYRPGPTRIRAGQAVLLDWGAVVDGYCSDLTRVVFTGRIPPKLAAAYEVVQKAQAAGVAAVRPGASCKSVDAAARKVIESAGRGDKFVHGLGHGIGLEVHEGPSLGRTADAKLKNGMVVTVEPGVYLPGVGGVRIEDDVLVTSKGRRRLSTLSRSPADMVLR
ncbi:MAG TPA: aminopeptidase P family protein [Phycisphaerae bacterium]|nr:aminopeptidase P family protein [Phycisphaerae bacterium]